jgi:WD40-like Beta Propeller Repeat
MKVAAPSPSARESSAERGRSASTIDADRLVVRPVAGAEDGRDTAQAPFEDTAQALFEEARRRRRRRYRWSAVALLLAALLVALTAWSLRDGAGPAPVAPRHRADRPYVIASKATMPTDMVVWAQVSRTTMAIQVVSSRTGLVLRTLATDDGLFNSTPQPTVSTDGTVFFDDAVAGSSTPGPGAPPPVERVMAVPFTGGPVTFVALGHDPAVSPNGRYLAYLTYAQVITRLGGVGVISDAPEGIVVRDLVTGASSTWSYSTSGPDIRRLTWTPDSRQLAFSTENLVGPVSHRVWHLSTRVIDVSGGNRRLDDARALPLPKCPPGPAWAFGTDHTMAWAGFLDEDSGIGICRYADVTGTEQSTQPVVVDLRTGREVSKLPAVHGLIGDGPGGGFQVDPSGRYLAYVGPGRGAGGLYRWALKDRGRASRPVLVRQQVGSVSWVPASLGDPGGS